MLTKSRTSLWPLALARVVIGLLWLISVRWKLPPAFAPSAGRGLQDWLLLEVQHPFLPAYGAFVEHVVLPNFVVFAWFIFLSELITGLSLLTGLFSRAGAALGLLLALNLGLGLLNVPGEWPWSYVMLAMWHAVFLASAPGRIWGLDGLIRRRISQRWVLGLT